MKKARSKFEEWAYAHVGGADGLAKALGVHRSAVGFWFQKKATPRTKHAMRIVSLAKGKLSLKDIIDGTVVKC